jgi:hypothetical protein
VRRTESAAVEQIREEPSEVSASDPLNLVGIVLPGPRVSSLARLSLPVIASVPEGFTETSR